MSGRGLHLDVSSGISCGRIHVDSYGSLARSDVEKNDEKDDINDTKPVDNVCPSSIDQRAVQRTWNR